MNDAWNASQYDQSHSYVTSYGQDVLALLNPQAGERILDVGCGTGHHVRALADAGVTAVGIDASPAMIAAARERYPGLQFEVADASDFVFDRLFDAVYSNAALHWVTAADAAAGCIARALRPGGRFVAELGGSGNIGAIVGAVQAARGRAGAAPAASPWFFPTVGEYAALLEKNGLEVRLAMLFDRPTELADGEQGLRGWLAMFGARLLDDLDPAAQEAVLADVEQALRPTLWRGGSWYADYRRLRVVAHKQGGLDGP
jgi:trans-aconitate methyltransferase